MATNQILSIINLYSNVLVKQILYSGEIFARHKISWFLWVKTDLQKFVLAKISILHTKSVHMYTRCRKWTLPWYYYCHRKAPCQLALSSRISETIKGADNEVSSVCGQSVSRKGNVFSISFNKPRYQVNSRTMQKPFILELGISITGSSVCVLTVHIFVQPLYIAASMNKLGSWPCKQLIRKIKNH